MSDCPGAVRQADGLVLSFCGQGLLDDVAEGHAQLVEIVDVGVVAGNGGGQAADEGVGDILAVQVLEDGEVLKVLDAVADILEADALHTAVDIEVLTAVEQHAVAVAVEGIHAALGLVLLIEAVVLADLIPVIDEVIEEAVHIVELLLPEQDAMTDRLGIHQEGDLGVLGTAGDIPPQLVALGLLLLHTLTEGTELLLDARGHAVGKASVVAELLIGGVEVGLVAPDIDGILDVGDVVLGAITVEGVVEVHGSHHLVTGEILFELFTYSIDTVQGLLTAGLIDDVEIGLIQPLLLLGEEFIGRLNGIVIIVMILPVDGIKGGHAGIVQIFNDTGI